MAGLNGSWLCLHGFAIWQQKGKNGARERFVLEIRTSSPSQLTADKVTIKKSPFPSKHSCHTVMGGPGGGGDWRKIMNYSPIFALWVLTGGHAWI